MCWEETGFFLSFSKQNDHDEWLIEVRLMSHSPDNRKIMVLENQKQFILTAEPFKVLDNSEMRMLERASMLRFAEKNEIIYSQGSKPDAVFILKNGKVKIGKHIGNSRKEVLKHVVLPGDIFGGTSWLLERDRDDFAQALENGVEYYQIEGETLRSLAKERME